MGSNILFNILWPAFVVLFFADFMFAFTYIFRLITIRKLRYFCYVIYILLNIYIVYLWYVFTPNFL